MAIQPDESKPLEFDGFSTPTNSEQLRAFVESLDLSGFKRQRLSDPVDEAFAQVQEALYPDEDDGTREGE